jgi:hypothetical protein
MNKFFPRLYYINVFTVVVLIAASLIDLIYGVMQSYINGMIKLYFDVFVFYDYITEFSYFFLAIFFLLFLVKLKSWKDWEFEDGKQKIKTWLDYNIFKISFYFYIIIGIIIFLKNSFYSLLLVLSQSSNRFAGNDPIIKFLTIFVPINILFFLFIFLFKKLKVQKFTESHLIIRIITVVTFIIFVYFSFPEVYICATYFLTLLPHSFVGIFQLIGCSLINMC